MFCCYIYFDPRPEKLEPIYVGKGREHRPDVHLTKGTHNLRFDRKLKKISSAGLAPQVIKTLVETEAQAFMLERFWIKVIGRLDLGAGSLCKYCGVLHDGSYGSGRFCSVQHARAFSTKKNVLHSNRNL